jgi:hypothetical protein
MSYDRRRCRSRSGERTRDSAISWRDPNLGIPRSCTILDTQPRHHNVYARNPCDVLKELLRCSETPEKTVHYQSHRIWRPLPADLLRHPAPRPDPRPWLRRQRRKRPRQRPVQQLFRRRSRPHKLRLSTGQRSRQRTMERTGLSLRARPMGTSWHSSRRPRTLTIVSSCKNGAPIPQLCWMKWRTMSVGVTRPPMAS